MSTFTRLFLGVWFGFATLIALFSVVYSSLALMSGDKTPGENHVLGLLFPPAFIAFAFVALWFFRRLGRKDRGSILEFLHGTLRTDADGVKDAMSTPAGSGAVG